MRLRLVEDRPDAGCIAANGLREQVYALDVATDGDAAEYEASVHGRDAVILPAGWAAASIPLE